jgi:lincosamide nucleotidyltransferase A/C/D/E
VFTAEDVLRIVRLLEDASIEVWLDGGWGVDALIGEQTRPHSDLDIVVTEGNLAEVRSILGNKGFRETDGGTAWNFVVADQSGLEVDVHVVRFDPEGNALYGPAGLLYDGLNAVGTVLGEPVHCKTAERQMADRVGYEWHDTDRHDVRQLNERLLISIPQEYAAWMKRPE